MRPRSGGHRRRRSAADFRRQRIIGIGWARERIPSLCFFGLGYVRCRDAKNRNGLLGSKRLRRNLDHKGHEGARRRFRGAVERRDCARIGKACKAKAREGLRSHRSQIQGQGRHSENGDHYLCDTDFGAVARDCTESKGRSGCLKCDAILPAASPAWAFSFVPLLD